MEYLETTIVKRSFEAAKHPKESKERVLLNIEAETSEYMTSYKYLAVIKFPETATHRANTQKYTCRTKQEAEEKIDDLLRRYGLRR